MMITGGQTVQVFRRPVRDRHGDGELELVGSIEHAVFQWASAASVGLRFRPSGGFQETSDLAAVFFLPRDSEVQVQEKDRIKMQGNLYQVIGDRAWDEAHPATGHNFGHYMVQVEMVS